MSDRVVVPAHMLHGSASEHYVLRVVGDSMIEEGICDGDFVVVLRRTMPEDGEVVVARVGDDATLKRFFREGPRVRLQPANAAMQSLYFPADAVEVQGVVVGLMRNFKPATPRTGGTGA